jgi:hypothetical protein
MSVPLLAAAGRRRAPVTLPGRSGRAPAAQQGLRYPPDPPTVEEIVASCAGPATGSMVPHMRALIVLLWRAGLRMNEALIVTEHDLDPRPGAILVRHGKGGRRREVGMDPWGWEHLRPWLELRTAMTVGQKSLPPLIWSRTVVQCPGRLPTLFDASSKTCSAALSTQLTQPASVVRLHPFLRESSLVVVAEDVDELEHDPAAVRWKRADR